MRIIESVAEMQHQADRWRGEERRIAFVPTMGFLHEGHLELMRMARRLGDVSVISIFVNPTQFGPGEDFGSYPRDLERDLDLVAPVGVDVAFVPGDGAMYAPGHQTHVEVTQVTRNLCGRSRPGHFRGVTTVVAKLFHAVKPHVAILGEKDYQQLVTIRRMVRDLNMDVEVVGHPTVREADGLAMSSRNVYLQPHERVAALSLSRSLERAQQLVTAGERSAPVILDAVRAIIGDAAGTSVDYVELCGPEDLEGIQQVTGPALLALAVRVGRARLIDNRVLQPPS